MPDLERLMRKVHIDMAKDETEKRIVKAYYTGMDRARKEVAVIFAVATLVFVLLRIVG